MIYGTADADRGPDFAADDSFDPVMAMVVILAVASMMVKSPDALIISVRRGKRIYRGLGVTIYWCVGLLVVGRRTEPPRS